MTYENTKFWKKKETSNLTVVEQGYQISDSMILDNFSRRQNKLLIIMFKKKKIDKRKINSKIKVL
jgi:hypothetical protein